MNSADSAQAAGHCLPVALREVVKKRALARAPGATGVQLGEESVRALILQGAANVFAKRGVRAASVEDILKASGISRRTFYRFHQNKEEVLVALYRMGTDELLAACRAAVGQEADPLRQLQGCVDAHLRNASEFGRLMFVLGGEAQRHESPLHARRMHVHAELVSLLAASGAGQRGSAKRVDPMLYRALLLSLEGVTRFVLEEGNEGRAVTEASIERARRVMMRIASAAIAGEGAGVTKLPTLA
jgi:AcrR family transcriptional regulator